MDDILSKLKVPAIGLIVTGILDFVLGALFTVDGIRQFAGFSDPSEFVDDTDRAFFFIGFRMVLAFFVLSFLVGPLIAFGGLQMLKGKNYRWAMTAAILSMIPVVFCSNPIGIILGVWSLVILMKPEVKDHFAATSK